MRRSLTVVLLAALSVFALLTTMVPAYAAAPQATQAPSDPQTTVIHVTGQFATLSNTCPSGDEFCAIDALTGDLAFDENRPGTNQLTLLTCQPSPACTEEPNTLRLIAYHDSVVTTTRYGTFMGDEHGTIKPLAGGELNAVDVLTSTDGCGSRLILHNRGTIDVLTFEDRGTYDGTVVLKTC